MINNTQKDNNGVKKILTIFLNDLKDNVTWYKKILSYFIIVLLLANFNLLDIFKDIEISYPLLVSLSPIIPISFLLILIKNPFSSLLAGVLGEFTQIIFTGVGIFFSAVVISIFTNFDFHNIILLFWIGTCFVVLKLLLAIFKYFEN